MKSKIIGLVLLGLAGAALAIEPAELDSRIRTLTDKFDSFQNRPDKAIPAETLSKAQGILLLDRTKAGLVFGYQGGGGVAMVKDPKREKWGPAAFVKSTGTSFGLLVGGEKNFLIVLFMTTNSTRMLLDPKFGFGGEATGTAGDSSGSVESKTAAEQSVLMYDDRQGLYASAAIKSGSLAADDEANRVYYGQPVSMGEILFDRKVKPTDAASSLAKKIHEYAKPAGR